MGVINDEHIDTWTARLMDLAGALDRETARRFVHEVYRGAQSDLDTERAAADFEREE
ncbi:hypothetical protein GCM10027160_19700 [Streptomyces calidiresistens]|uniref:Uncharacterized protein n=1 Tax=Streptomyces calidiresistens TaxID=1485586 RepID=A0A7W3XVK6_9ACTN|nr:hypothetical protein [Streptomyces calidiresistens]MBB0228817.1 hypothetical protein [Streptomyces calidiresistens]